MEDRLMDAYGVTAIYNLTSKTRTGEIRWTWQSNENQPIGRVSRISEQYTGDYNGERLRLQVINDYGLATSDEVRLQLLNSDGSVLWEFPHHSALRDLLSTVRSRDQDLVARLQRLLG